MIDVREMVPAYELLPGDVVEFGDRAWTTVGQGIGQITVRLVEMEDAADSPAVLHVSRQTSVVRVARAQPLLYGDPGLEWTIHPVDEPVYTGESTGQQRLGNLLTAVEPALVGDYDRRVLELFAAVHDTQEIASLTGMIVRARDAGPHPSRQLGGSQPDPVSAARAGHDASDAAMAAEPAPAPAELHDEAAEPLVDKVPGCVTCGRVLPASEGRAGFTECEFCARGDCITCKAHGRDSCTTHGQGGEVPA